MARTKIHPTFKIANRELFPREYFEEIGVLIVQANFLESYLRKSIVALIGAEAKEGDIAISGMNLRTMLHVLRSLVYHKLPHQWERYDRLAKHLKRAIEIRNSVAHSVITPETCLEKNHLYFRGSRVRAKRGIVSTMQLEKLTLHKIRRNALYIFRTFVALDDFLKDSGIDFCSMRLKS